MGFESNYHIHNA